MMFISKRRLGLLIREEVDRRMDKYEVCEKCGGLFKETAMKKVIGYNHIIPISPRRNYYCKKCAPPYDSIERYLNGTLYYKNNVEVDEKGKIKRRTK